MDLILQARGITQAFPDGGGGQTTVLHGVDLDVERGELLAVMGPSGSGKSTLLYALSGLERPSAGTVRLEGTDLGSLSQQELAALRLTRMGFVFQQPHLLKNLTLLDNVVLPGFVTPDADRRAVTRRARELMARAGVGELADREPTQASGGQLQRVGICRALVNDPPVVFADEPTGALNSQASAGVMDLLTEVNAAGTTLVAVTHDVRVAARAHRVVFMSDGHVTGERRMPSTAGPEERAEQLAGWLVGQGF